jgi:hypothetical protein
MAPNQNTISDYERTRRRTTAIVMTNTVTGYVDTVHVCELPCRNEFRRDLGIRGGHGWAYKPRGSAAVTVAWNQQTYDVTWARRRLNPDYCDTCGEAWRCHVPELITAAEARKGRPAPPPTERQLAARAAFADRKHREAAERADKLSQELVST